MSGLRKADCNVFGDKRKQSRSPVFVLLPNLSGVARPEHQRSFLTLGYNMGIWENLSRFTQT